MASGWVIVTRWAEMVKLSHSVFALPFALTATCLASSSAWRAGRLPHIYPTLGQSLLILICMVTARSVAMTFNRIVDARFDARNPRTASRALPAGTITVAQAWMFLLMGAGTFVLATLGFWVWFGNPWPARLALPVLAYVGFYSYTKRFTAMAHLVLGSAIALSPVAAWVAIDPASLGWPALVLMLAVTFWIAGFDIIYACQDLEFDRAQGLHSLPARLGPRQALRLARLAHVTTVALLVALLGMTPMAWIGGVGVAAVAVLLAIEHALVRADDFSRVNLAFFTMNGLVSLVWGALAIIDVLRGS